VGTATIAPVLDKMKRFQKISTNIINSVMNIQFETVSPETVPSTTLLLASDF
jgi:hypothetical protein